MVGIQPQSRAQMLSGKIIRLTATRQSAYPNFLFHCYSDPVSHTAPLKGS
jgi:hypothetical protein